MATLGLRLEELLKYRLGLGHDVAHEIASGLEETEEIRWYALGLTLGALAMKRRYDPDPKIDEVIDKLNQLDIRSRENLEAFIKILEDYLKEIGWLSPRV